MCLESTGLHEITSNLIKNIHCYPPRGLWLSCHLPPSRYEAVGGPAE